MENCDNIGSKRFVNILHCPLKPKEITMIVKVGFISLHYAIWEENFTDSPAA